MINFFIFFSENPLAYLFVAIFGLILGSFFNVVIYRLPLGRGLGGRSKCRSCQNIISWKDNIPVFSFLFRKGKCRHCQTTISIEYPVVELLSSLLWGLSLYCFGMSWAFLFYGILLSYLLIISVIDIHHQIIPDELSLSGIPLGLLAAWLINDITWWESLLGIGFGGAIFWGVALLYEKITKREGLGGGDVKLLAMLGAWLGYQSILPIIIISSALGTVFGLSLMLIKKKNFKMAIPFGPFLAAAAVIFLFAKEPILTLIFSTEK